MTETAASRALVDSYVRENRIALQVWADDGQSEFNGVSKRTLDAFTRRGLVWYEKREPGYVGGLTEKGRAVFDQIADVSTATVGAVAPQKRGILTDTDRARIVAAIEARKAADEVKARADRELFDAIAAAAAHGASVRVMAEDLGVSTNTISRWKRGE